MWEELKKDTTTKSTLFLSDAEDELASMKCRRSTDVKTHLAELTAHFNLMVRHKENLIEMGLLISDTHFNAMIMASLPVSYHPMKQMISAAERTTKTPMSLTDLIAFFTEEAWNWYLEDQQASQAKSVPYVHKSKHRKSRKGVRRGSQARNVGIVGRMGTPNQTVIRKGEANRVRHHGKKKERRTIRRGRRKLKRQQILHKMRNSLHSPAHLIFPLLQKLFKSRN